MLLGRGGSWSVKKAERASTLAAYYVFALCAFVVLVQFTDHDFSLVLTLSAGVQCLGFFLLSSKVRRSQSAAGLSSRTLEMYVLFFLTRLSSTMVKNGYLPIDRSGDWVYQIADIGSLGIVLQLLYSMHRSHKTTYEGEHDTLPIRGALPACLLLAICVHGDLNDSPVFDTLWTFSLLVDTIAMLPQLWMMTTKGGEVESLTSHFVAAMVVSRALSFTFWFYGYSEIAPQAGGFNAAGYLILAAHSLQLVLSADFMYYYVRSAMRQQGMVLPTMEV